MKRLQHLACAAAAAASLAWGGFDTRVGPLPGGTPTLPTNMLPAQLQGVGIEERLGSPVDLDLQFTGEDGYPVALRSFFHSGRPVLLNLVYYNCPMLCTMILNGQVAALKQIPWMPGNEFEIVSISIDPREAFNVAREKKATYLEVYNRPAPGWHFLTDYQGNVKKLAEQIGFHYRYDARQEQYAHTAAIMVLTPEGKMSRYLYGVQYKARDLRLALTEASQGGITLTVDKVLLFCYHYDPQANGYVLFATNVMRIGGAMTTLILGFFIWRMFRAERIREGTV